MTTTATRPTFSETVTMYGTEHTITAVSLDGRRRSGARYDVLVDGDVVYTVTWKGGRRYNVQATGDDLVWEFVTGDGGAVSDVATYVARSAIHGAHDAAERAAAEVEAPVFQIEGNAAEGDVMVRKADWALIQRVIREGITDGKIDADTAHTLLGMTVTTLALA